MESRLFAKLACASTPLNIISKASAIIDFKVLAVSFNIPEFNGPSLYPTSSSEMERLWSQLQSGIFYDPR